MSTAADPGVRQPRAAAPPGPPAGAIVQIRTKPVDTVDQLAAKLDVTVRAGRQVQVLKESALTTVPAVGLIVGRVSR